MSFLKHLFNIKLSFHFNYYLSYFSIFTFFLIIIIDLTCNITYAYIPQEGNATATYSLIMYRTEFYEGPSSAKSPYLLDFGLVANGDLNSNSSIEVSIFHLNKIFFRTQNSQVLSEKTQSIQIITAYRFWLNSEWATGLGLSSLFPIGDVHTQSDSGNLKQNYTTSASETVNNGLDFFIEKEIITNSDFSITLNLHYNYSISAKENENSNQYGLVLGYRRIVQKK